MGGCDGAIPSAPFCAAPPEANARNAGAVAWPTGQAARWPALDAQSLMPLLLGLLGLGALRTYEKVQA